MGEFQDRVTLTIGQWFVVADRFEAMSRSAIMRMAWPEPEKIDGFSSRNGICRRFDRTSLMAWALDDLELAMKAGTEVRARLAGAKVGYRMHARLARLSAAVFQHQMLGRLLGEDEAMSACPSPFDGALLLGLPMVGDDGEPGEDWLLCAMRNRWEGLRQEIESLDEYRIRFEAVEMDVRLDPKAACLAREWAREESLGEKQQSG